MQDHLATLKQALHDECEWNRQQHISKEKLSVADRIATGIAWPPLKIIRYSDVYRRRLDIDLRQIKGASLHDGIKPGDLVSLSPIERGNDFLSGICRDVYLESCTIQLRNLPKDFSLPKWLLFGDVVATLRFDPSTFIQYSKGLERAEQHQSRLKTALLSTWVGQEQQQPIQNAWPKLNTSQQIAAQTAIKSKEIAIIHGPPGTGKTHTLTTMIQSLLAQKTSLWACADSNAAVDHLCESLSRKGIDVLRLGSEFRISKDVWPMSLWYKIENHPQRTAIKALEKQIVRSNGIEKRNLVAEKRKLEKQIRLQIIENCQVICSTLGTISREAPYLEPVHTVLIDEATQAIEPAVWSIVPFTKRIILVGDPHQLGPVITSPKNPLAKSLLERLIEQTEFPPPMLEIQHRMNDAIRQLVEKTYGKNYRSHEDVFVHLLNDIAGVKTAEITTQPAMWIDTAGTGSEEHRDPFTFSLYNEIEIKLVEKVVEKLLIHGVNSAQIGVITPYSAQVSRLRKSLPSLEVNTVNAFQGREKEVIICSFVRSNDSGELGFVADQKRLTVAITRARRLWVGIGDSATLAKAKAFANLFSHLEQYDIWQSYWDWCEM